MGNITKDIQRAYSSNVQTQIKEDNDRTHEIGVFFGGLNKFVKLGKAISDAEAPSGGSNKSSSSSTSGKDLAKLVKYTAGFRDQLESTDMPNSQKVALQDEYLGNVFEAGYTPTEVKSVIERMGVEANFKAIADINEANQDRANSMAKDYQTLGAAAADENATDAEKEALGRRIMSATELLNAGIKVVANTEGAERELALAQLVRPMEDTFRFALKQVTKDHFSYDQLVVAKDALKNSFVEKGLPPEFVTRKVDLAFEGYEKFLQAKGEDAAEAAKALESYNNLKINKAMGNFLSTPFMVAGEPLTGAELMSSAKLSPDLIKHMLVNYEGGVSSYIRTLAGNAAGGVKGDPAVLKNSMTDKDIVTMVDEALLQANREAPDKMARQTVYQGSLMAVDKLNERALQDIRDGKADPMKAAHAATTAYENVIKYSTPEMLKEGQEDGSVGEMTARLLSTVAAASEKQEEGDLVLVNPVTYRTNAFRKISAGSGAGSVEGVSSPSGASNDRAVRTVKAIAKANSISFANAAKMYNRAMMLENDNFQDLIQAQGLESVEAIDAYLGRLMVSPTRFKAIDQEAAEADPVKSLMKTLPTKDGTKVTYGDLPDIGKAPAEEPTKAPVEEADEGTLKADEKAEILSSPVPSKEPSKVTDKEITWKLEKGTEVASPVSGKVEASVILRGEGVMLIRDAQGKLVALQGLGESMFQEGEEVEEGDILGIVDSSGVLKLSRSGKAKGKLFPVKLPFKLGKRA